MNPRRPSFTPDHPGASRPSSSNPPDPSDPARERRWPRVKAAVTVLVVLAVLALLGRQIAGYVTTFAIWVDGLGALGPITFMLGYAIGTVAMVPGSLLSLAAGTLFGFGAGSVYVFVGATAGASAAFLIARYIARESLERRFGSDRRFTAINQAIAQEGGQVVFLLRMSPIFPFNLLNYVLGLSRVRFVHFLAASIGMVPGIALYVYAGHVAGDLARLATGVATERSALHYLLLCIGLVATLAVTVLVTRAARRSLRGIAR